MTVWESTKGVIEAATGLGRPRSGDLDRFVIPRQGEMFRFADDGETPNNPRLPLVLYRAAVRLPEQFDPAAIFEDLFAANGWKES